MEGFFSLLCTLPELESVKSIAMLLSTKYYSFFYAKVSKLGVNPDSQKGEDGTELLNSACFAYNLLQTFIWMWTIQIPSQLYMVYLHKHSSPCGVLDHWPIVYSLLSMGGWWVVHLLEVFKSVASSFFICQKSFKSVASSFFIGQKSLSQLHRASSCQKSLSQLHQASSFARSL